MSDSQALSILFKSPVSQEMIHHLVVATLQVLPCAQDKYPSPPNSPSTNTKQQQQQQQLPSLMTFITKLVRYTNVYTGTLMSTVVYLNRLRSKLPKDAQGLSCTRHRIFLACLILSSKYHNDSSPKNKHWAKYTDSLFDIADVNLMERQLLYLLDWDLRINEDELANSLRKFIDPIKTDLRKLTKVRRTLQRQQQRQSQQQQHHHHHSPHHQQQQQQQKHRLSVSTTPSPSHSPIRNSSSMESLHSRASSTCSVRTLNSDNEESMILKLNHQQQQQYQQSIIQQIPTSQKIPQLELMNSKSAALNEERELVDLLRQYELRY